MEKKSKKNREKTETSFFERVYQVTSMIPRGRVTTYGAIARFAGSPGAARMVGWALNSTKTSENFVPAHRVVNRNGRLTGKRHFGTSSAMAQLLENENILIKDNQVMNFKEVFWDPNKWQGDL
jgi:methylated-DNA-protein-cysteine methyltransferase-like protein